MLHARKAKTQIMGIGPKNYSDKKKSKSYKKAAKVIFPRVQTNN